MDSSIVTDALFPLQGPFATIHGVEMTRGAAQVAIDAIKSMSDKSLKAKRKDLEMATLDPGLVRKRLIAAVSTAAPLPNGLVAILKKRLPAYAAFEIFSDTLIVKAEPLWPALFGQHAAGLALALGDSPERREVGRRMLNQNPDTIRSDPREAGELLFRLIGGAFWGQISELAAVFNSGRAEWAWDETESEIETGSAPGRRKAALAGEALERTNALEAQVASLTAQVQAEKDLACRGLSLKEQECNEKLSAERERSNRASVLESKLNASIEREQALLLSIAEKERLFEDEVQTRVERELSALVRPWLEEARRLQGLSAERTDKSLMERAASLLHAQEALDMKHGSRTRLRRRLKEFEDCASKIRGVLEDSIKPSEEFVPLLGEIEAEIQRTRVVLGEDRPQSPLVHKLEEAIHKASSSEALDSLADNLAALHTAGVFTHKEHLRLTKQKLKAYDRLRTQHELKPTVHQRRSGWELCQAVGSNKKAVVYLDGNNIVHRDDRYAHLFDVSGRITEEVENALRRDVLELATKARAVTFRVVFDSHTSSEEAVTENVILHRSGGSGTDRADSAIVLHILATPDVDNRFVITDDNSLRHQTSRIGGVYAEVALWDVLLESFGVEALPHVSLTAATRMAT
jgi:hypothetical protein